MGPGMGHCRGPGTPASGPRRGRIARIRRSAWAAIEIPGYLSPAPSDPLLGLWVRAVVLSGAGERGLCAGGDVVAVYHSAGEDGVEARRFWRAEYLLNGQIGRFAKPYVSLMDGIVMGGGVGVSAHANIRVVTDTSKVAMPEVGIGFVPDVGGAFLLARAPGLLGLHAALTGAPFSGADAIALGFADHFVPHDKVESVR